jgi:lipopolysaccharide/colanic/teichoic acid biosynthesis glycosyltransferase
MPHLQELGSPDRDQTLCRLLWRQKYLWVLPASLHANQVVLPALAQPEWVQSCLERSKAKAVVIDPKLGSEVIDFWAQACYSAGKPLYLRLSAMPDLPAKQNFWAWRVKCLLERLIGLVLLALLIPLTGLFAILLNLQDGGSPYCFYWCIGQRGRIFRMAQFRRKSVLTGQKTVLGQFLECSRLDRLPRLLNLVRGEMTLIGTKPWNIDEAVKVPAEYQPCLNAMPGIVGPRPMGLNLSSVDIRDISQREISYLKNWTLWGDSQTGLLAVVQILTGSMAQ